MICRASLFHDNVNKKVFKITPPPSKKKTHKKKTQRSINFNEAITFVLQMILKENSIGMCNSQFICKHQVVLF